MKVGRTEAVRVRRAYDGTGGAPREDAVLLWRDGRIVALIDAADRKAAECCGIGELPPTPYYLTPGLIDTHVHLMMPGNGTAAEDAYRGTPPGEQILRALTNALTALAAGVTTLRDCGSADGISRTVRNFMRNGEVVGPEVLICGAPITPTGGHCHYMGGEADDPGEIRKMIRREQKAGIDFVKVMASSGGTAGVPKGVYFSGEELAVAAEEAHRMQLKIAMHTSSLDAVRAAAEAGADSIEHTLFFNDGGPVVRDWELAGLIEERGIFLCPTLAALGASLRELNAIPRERWTAGQRAEYDRSAPMQERILETLEFLNGTGIRITAGSDAGWRYCSFRDGMTLSMELMEACGMAPGRVIAAATGLAAEELGVAGRVGRLERGLQADFLLLEKDPGAGAAAFRRIAQVWKNGRQVTNFLP